MKIIPGTRAYFWSFCVMGAIIQWYQHSTMNDTIHHQHELKKWKPDKTGYTSHRATWAEIVEQTHEWSYILHPKCIPGD